MGSPWHEVALGDLIQVRHGWPLVGNLCSDCLTGCPIVVNIGNFRYTGGFRFDETTTREYRGEYPASFALQPGDILLVMTCQTPGGEILGIPAQVPDDGRTYLHNQRMGKVVVVRPDLVRNDYLYWLFLWRDFNEELVASSTGTKILHTAPSRIEAFRFPLPSIREQGAIADVLNILAEKIELNRQMNKTLEATARAIFKSWFVDFEPVAAKAADRRLAGVGSQSADVFPNGFQGSPVGSIPNGWAVSRIGDEVRVVGGSTPRTNEPTFWEGGAIHWATPKDLATLTDPVLLDTERRITREGLGQISSGLLPVGIVLLSSRAPIGYLAISEVATAVNQGFIAMVCAGRLPNYYVFQWAREAMDEITSRAGGTTFAEISRASFRPILVLVPDEPVLRAYVEVVRPLYEKIVSNVQESRALSTVHEALLPKLFSGELRPREAEKLVGRAGA